MRLKRLLEESELPSKDDILKALKNHPIFKLKEKPIRVFVVGSYAYGNHTDLSDIDILLEIPRKSGFSEIDVQNLYRKKIQDYFVKNNIRGVRDDLHPNWKNTRIDVYFTYDASKETGPKIEI